MLRLAAIRSGTGHLDLANDLAALHGMYREFKAVIEGGRKNYRATDEDAARALSERILTLLGAAATPEQTLWRAHQARAFTLLLRYYEEAVRVGRFIFHYRDGEALFPSLHSAVRAAPKAKPQPEPAPGPGATTP